MRQMRKGRRGGITLLLTLMALVVLTVVLIEFQSNAVVTGRTDQFRVEQLQCRYAAESGMVIATAMIKASRQRGFKPEAPSSEPAEETPETSDEPVADPNLLDPNSPLDPNALAANLPDIEPTVPPEPRPDFVIAYQTVELGPATVTIEIHDENAKWPLYWLLESPFNAGGGSGAVSAFNAYVSRLGVSREAGRKVMKLTGDMGKGIKLPPPPMRIVSAGRDGNLSMRGRRVQFSERVAELEERHKGMVRFASIWHDGLLQNPDEDLLQEVADMPGTFLEYLSPWGVANINLNTATAELLEAAYSPIGLTQEQAQAIVSYRKETPLRSVNQLHQVPGLNIGLINRLSAITVVTSDTFSVHVEARVGRIVNRLVGGVFQDLDWNVRIAGVFPGG